MMSVKAMAWAFEQKLDPTRKLILLTIADHADESGGCWPSMNRIADICQVTRQTVVSHIKALEELGLLSKKSRRRESDGGQTSNFYQLPLSKYFTPPCKADHTPPVKPALHQEPSLESPIRTSSSIDDEFEAFWSVVPRKIGKKNSKRSFIKARKSASLEDLIKGIERYKAHKQEIKSDVFMHPSTWLNGEHWEDELETQATKGGLPF